MRVNVYQTGSHQQLIEVKGSLKNQKKIITRGRKKETLGGIKELDEKWLFHVRPQMVPNFELGPHVRGLGYHSIGDA